MMKFIQFNHDEMLNIECIECMYRNYLGGTTVIGKSGKQYTTEATIEKVMELIEKLEASTK